MKGLREKKYLHVTRKRFDPIALLASVAIMLVVIGAGSGVGSAGAFFDLRSFLVVIGGTTASLLFQFDFSGVFYALKLIAKSFLGTPDKPVLKILKELDQAILKGTSLVDLRVGDQISGEMLNDIVYMHHQNLLFEEIDAFVTSRIQDQYVGRQVAVNFLQKASIIAPAFGLFGTVIGLVEVMRSLSNPGQIGPSMSLALMTTAYGAGLGSVVFTPLAGRLEHHNSIYLEVHKQLLSKIGILLAREERRLDRKSVLEVA